MSMHRAERSGISSSKSTGKQQINTGVPCDADMDKKLSSLLDIIRG